MSDPCKCHDMFGVVIPSHTGHCCFYSPSATCHADEVAEWNRKNDERRATLADAARDGLAVADMQAEMNEGDNT